MSDQVAGTGVQYFHLYFQGRITFKYVPVKLFHLMKRVFVFGRFPAQLHYPFNIGNRIVIYMPVNTRLKNQPEMTNHKIYISRIHAAKVKAAAGTDFLGPDSYIKQMKELNG